MKLVESERECESENYDKRRYFFEKRQKSDIFAYTCFNIDHNRKLRNQW